MKLTEAMRNVLEVSVLKEQEAHDFYAAAARKVSHDSLRELFERLAGDEIGHRLFLEKLLSDDQPPMTIKPQTVDYKLAEQVIGDKPDFSLDMSLAEAVALAIKREEEAMTTYGELADESETAELRELFTNLRNMEQAHKTALESVYLNLAYAEVW
jgi:rubrerythrin